MELEKKRRKEAEKNAEKEDELMKKKESSGRPYTVSIALPGSILDNAQSAELRAYLGGQVRELARGGRKVKNR